MIALFIAVIYKAFKKCNLCLSSQKIGEEIKKTFLNFYILCEN